MVQRLARSLTDTGIMLISLYGQSVRAQAIAQTLSAQYQVLDVVTIVHARTARSWVCQGLCPAKRRDLPMEQPTLKTAQGIGLTTPTDHVIQ